MKTSTGWPRKYINSCFRYLWWKLAIMGTFKVTAKLCSPGEPGWLSRLGVQLQLRSRSQSVGSRPALGSVLTAQSLEPALDSVSPSLFATPLHIYEDTSCVCVCVCVCVYTHINNKRKKKENPKKG